MSDLLLRKQSFRLELCFHSQNCSQETKDFASEAIACFKNNILLSKQIFAASCNLSTVTCLGRFYGGNRNRECQKKIQRAKLCTLVHSDLLLAQWKPRLRDIPNLAGEGTNLEGPTVSRKTGNI